MWSATMTVLLLGAFVVVSARLYRFSREALRDPRSYGFWRFFGWEAILVLLLLNGAAWFVDPLSVRQLASWALLCPAAVIAFHGYSMLRAQGNPEGTFEGTTQLVRRGLFRTIRHPMYTSLLLVTWGIYLKGPGLLTTAVAVFGTAVLFTAARAEERQLIGKFGDEYLQYRRETRMFVPYVF